MVAVGGSTVAGSCGEVLRPCSSAGMMSGGTTGGGHEEHSGTEQSFGNATCGDAAEASLW